MRLDLTVIKNETSLKFDKAMDKVADKFIEMLSISLDTASPEIDKEKREHVELALQDLFSDEFNNFKAQFIHTMFKAGDLIENGLGS